MSLPQFYVPPSRTSVREQPVGLGPGPGGNKVTFPSALGSELSDALQELGRREGVSVSTVLWAGLQVLLYRLRGQVDSAVNALPLQNYLSGDPNFRDLLGLLKEAGGAVPLHPAAPWEHALDALGAEYGTNARDPAAAERMSTLYRTLLEAVVQDPNQPISGFPYLTAVEQRQLLVEWNDTQRDYPDLCVHQLFEQQVERTPNAVAVLYEERQLTYRELNEKSNQLTHYLRASGVVAKTLVGLHMERSIEMIVAMLGILKAGGVYVPMDPEFPSHRLQVMLDESGTALVVTTESWRLPKGGATVQCINPFAEEIASMPTENPEPWCTPEDVAYVLFTSGSTGRPKGVSVPHRALVNFLSSMRRQPGISEHDVVLAVTTISFDIAALEIYGPLVVGARVVVASRETVWDGRRLAQMLETSQSTILQGTPAMYRCLLASGWQGDPHLKVLCGGEAMTPQLARELIPRCGCLWNMYGPTETTVWSTIREIRDAEDASSIGRPIDNTQIYILDTCQKPAGIGIRGELYIGGDGLALGYWNRPELTAERFVPHPFVTESRLYRTGDYARYRASGDIEYLGRVDQQIKIRGFRIELGEIEAVLRQHPAVAEAAVVVREGDNEDKRLVAYFQRGGEEGGGEELRAFLKLKLPDYMVPAVWIAVKEFPLTPNGKIDRAALSSAQPITRTEEIDTTAADPLLLQLLAIWRQVLGAPNLKPSDDFFDMGGHSLLAARLFVQTEKTFGVRIPLGALVQAPTAEQFAAMLRDQKWLWQNPCLVPIQPLGTRPILFCAHALGGNVLSFRGLATHLGTERPVYGLQAIGLDGSELPLRRVEDMAERYVREIRTVQPAGPYYLAGHSFGGLVAYEMACQLCQVGEEVAFLGLIDSALPKVDEKPLIRARASIRVAAKKVRFRVASLSRLSGRKRLAYAAWRFELLFSRMRNRTVQMREVVGSEVPPSYQDVLEASDEAQSTYKAKPYSGDAVLFRAEFQPDYFEGDPLEIWSKLISGGLTFRATPGDHSTMLLEPHVRNLAEEIKALIDRRRDIEIHVPTAPMTTAAASGR
jgi:amino acid adenylation domain-containing protein